MSQLQGATNPASMLIGMLNPSQKQMVNMFQGKSSQEQAEAIASKCNELGLSKEQFAQIVKCLGRSKKGLERLKMPFK